MNIWMPLYAPRYKLNYAIKIFRLTAFYTLPSHYLYDNNGYLRFATEYGYGLVSDSHLFPSITHNNYNTINKKVNSFNLKNLI